MIAYQNDDEQYQQALDFLYGFINLEQRVIDRYQASKMDTARPRRLMAMCGNPHESYPTIHIAGTKGKGSVAAMCTAVLRAAGLRVGLYTSPHLREFRERIRVLTPEDEDGRISKTHFVNLIADLRPLLPSLPGITWFEIVTAVAFCYFAQQSVDVAVIEVGLGGRLDATNVITPLVSVITSLSLDHTALLGDTLSQISREKGGIIKPGVPVVTAPQKEEALQPLLQLSAERESPISVVGRNWRFYGRSHELTITHAPNSHFLTLPATFRLALAGQHQLENATVAIAALYAIRKHFPALNQAAIAEGLATVKWHGRLQIIHQSPNQPTFLVDAAHNEDSTAKLAFALTHDYQF